MACSWFEKFPVFHHSVSCLLWALLVEPSFCRDCSLPVPSVEFCQTLCINWVGSVCFLFCKFGLLGNFHMLNHLRIAGINSTCYGLVLIMCCWNVFSFFLSNLFIGKSVGDSGEGISHLLVPVNLVFCWEFLHCFSSGCSQDSLCLGDVMITFLWVSFIGSYLELTDLYLYIHFFPQIWEAYSQYSLKLGSWPSFLSWIPTMCILVGLMVSQKSLKWLTC